MPYYKVEPADLLLLLEGGSLLVSATPAFSPFGFQSRPARCRTHRRSAGLSEEERQSCVQADSLSVSTAHRSLAPFLCISCKIACLEAASDEMLETVTSLK